MKHLIINDTMFGEVETYHQDRENSAWIFSMSNRITISVPFSEIKWFTSHEDLEIILA